jgi:hypothetical protein
VFPDPEAVPAAGATVAAGAVGATTVAPPAALLAPAGGGVMEVPAGGGAMGAPAAEGATAAPRVGVSPVVVPPAPPGPAVVWAVPSELPLALISTPDPRVLRLRSYSVPESTPPGASLSATV